MRSRDRKKGSRDRLGGGATGVEKKRHLKRTGDSGGWRKGVTRQRTKGRARKARKRELQKATFIKCFQTTKDRISSEDWKTVKPA